ncbi:MAG: DUF494 family protein [Candidatus Krumholzibacteriota bacterium]|nr:DUF494 family protein [Candidatus Krumholzibacteriota bacterium]
MKGRIREIIEYIIDSESVDSADIEGINDELEEMGYSLDEISQAMTILDFGILDDSIESGSQLYTKNRILGEGEKILLTTDAQGYLIKLQTGGWITEAQLNIIIENAGMEYRIPVSINEIKELVMGFAPDVPEEVVDGSDCSTRNLN